MPGTRARVPGYSALRLGEKTVDTRDTNDALTSVKRVPIPGAVLVFSMGRATMVPMRLEGDREIGRGSFAGALEDDDRVSRKHVRIDANADGFVVRDLESRNGTLVGGAKIESTRARAGAIVRIGHSLILLVSDVLPFETPRDLSSDTIVGPLLRPTWDAIESAAKSEGSVLLVGESGSGKEVAAHAFHEATGRTGPLVAVNCAAIPTGLAERLLFGTRKGAYSGADADADGYVQSAHNGTLFLDEIAELEPLVQAKLLRVLETHEVYALGASKPRTVDVRICSATLKDLRGAVARGAFRQDLYYRIGRPEVRLPPLRERTEEIPWHVARIAKEQDVTLHVSFVEACMLRPWPGNIRELLAETKRAAHAAKKNGEIEKKHLADNAGTALEPVRDESPTAKSAPDDETIERALEKAEGNVTQAARDLGMHRTQLRRWIAKKKPT